MSRRSIFTVRFRRRRAGLTDYKSRIRLLKSGEPRLVIRKSLNNLTAQIITYSRNGDNVLISANSGELKKLGWIANTGNIPSAYLVGLLLGKRALKSNIKSAIVDIGIAVSSKGSRTYSALKGAIDAGLDIPYNKDVLPDDKRVSGVHIAEYSKKLSQEELGKKFSRYLKDNVAPADIGKLFESVKEKIEKL